MNNFGMGFILNFVDNASSGMRNASQNFQMLSDSADKLGRIADPVMQSVQALSMTGIGLSMVGGQVSSAGASIIDTYQNMTQTVIQAGGEMLGYRMQMNALYHDEAENQMKSIMDYAKKSVFEVKNLIPAVIMMKTVGMNAMQELTGSISGKSQKLLDYASDIAAMVPNMRNTYGTGVQAAMGAIKEYVAEGNALSLKRGAGMDILGILGEKKGATMEERAQQIANLVDKLGILGYTVALQGTPTQRLSNIQDVWFQVLTKIADSGVFERYTKMLGIASDYVFGLSEDESRLNAITGLVADTINNLLDSLTEFLKLLVPIVDKVIVFLKEHPTLAKFLGTLGIIGGVALVAVGSVLKLAGSFFVLAAGILMAKLAMGKYSVDLGLLTGSIKGVAVANESVASSLTAKSIFSRLTAGSEGLWKFFKNIPKMLWGGVKSIFGLFKNIPSLIAGGAKALWLFCLPLIKIGLIVGALHLAWKYNFLGIRSLFESLWEGAQKLWTMFNLVTSSFDGKMTGGELKLAKQFGLMGIINAIQILRFRWQEFMIIFNKFKQDHLIPMGKAFSEALTDILPFFGWVAEKISWLFSNVIGPVVGKGIFALVKILTYFFKYISWVFGTSLEEKLQVFSDFFGSIFSAICNTLKEAINWIIDGINTFITGVNQIKIPDSVPIVGGTNFNISTIPRLSTGGEITGEGLAVLHPNEVVVNSPLVQDLKAFMQANSPRQNGRANSSSSTDNSVTFSEGSIVINVENADTGNLEQIADKLMKIMARKLELRNMSVRTV